MHFARRIEEKCCRVTGCVGNGIYTHLLIFSYVYVCTYARLIFHSISTRIATRLTVAKRAVGATDQGRKFESRSDSARYCSFESGISRRFVSIPLSPPFPRSFPSFSPVAAFFIRGRERKKTSFSLFFVHAACNVRRL